MRESYPYLKADLQALVRAHMAWPVGESRETHEAYQVAAALAVRLLPRIITELGIDSVERERQQQPYHGETGDLRLTSPEDYHRAIRR